MCYEAKSGGYDLVVVDADSSGNVSSLLAAPRTIRSLAQVGMLREQTDWMIEMLSNAEVCSVMVVTTPEESPVDETLDLIRALRDEAQVSVPVVVVNRMPSAPPRGVDVIAPRISALLGSRHDAANVQVQRLVRAPGAETIDVVSVPRVDGDEVDVVADALDDEFGEAL